ncbi:MAG: hypothetical protein A2W80_15810 [Candidatus Riflebacteria bacterium GWC2_50_8]|nr:MAG: hypothetical protein A2W80_15810 [Candidatus Riflebacteria bacterium GWC2_50_8]
MTVKENIERVRMESDIVDVIMDYNVVIEQKGPVYKGLCPFHAEKTPSFTVYPETQSFYCFGCNKGGDVFAFVGMMDNTPFREAFQKLADKNVIPLNRPAHKPHSMRERHNYKIHTEREKIDMITAACYSEAYMMARHTLLFKSDGKIAANHLRENGFTDDHIKRLEIGAYTPSIRKHLWDIYGEERLRQTGLISYGMGYNYQLVMPHRDLKGDIVGLVARLVNCGVYSNGDPLPKYRFTNNLDKSIPFNLFGAADDIRKRREVIIVEGHFDALTLVAHDFPQVISLAGNSLSRVHIDYLKDLEVKTAYLYLDNDSPGIAATEKALKLLAGCEEIYPFVVETSQDCKDAKAYFKAYSEHPNPSEAFMERLRSAKSGWKWLADSMALKVQSDRDKVLVIEEAKDVYSMIYDPISKQDFLKTFSEGLKVSSGDLKKMFLAKPPWKKARPNALELLLERINLMITNNKSIFDIQEFIKEHYQANRHKMSRDEKNATSIINVMCGKCDIEGIRSFVDSKLAAIKEQ